jgi:chromosome segregation ATPase
MAEYETPHYAVGDSGGGIKVAKKAKKVISPPPTPTTTVGVEREIIVEIPPTLDGKIKLLSKLINEQSNTNRKLSRIEEKLMEMTKKDTAVDISEKLLTIEKLRKLEKLNIVEDMEKTGVRVLSDDPNELIELYRVTQEKLVTDRKRMAEVREKLHKIIRDESAQEENNLKNLLKTLTIIRERLDVLEKISAIEGVAGESDKLISMLRKRKDELEAEIEEERKRIEQEAIEKQRQLEELEKQKQLAAKAEEKKEEEPKGFLQKLLFKFKKKKKPRVVKIIACPKCRSKIEITSEKRPLKIKCSKCGAEGTLKK